MKLLHLMILICIVVTGAHSQYTFPLRASANNRYFVDQNGTPFFLNGDAPWDMPAGLSYTDSKRYIDNADSSGFTFVVVRLITKGFTTHAPNNAYNVPPFTGAIFRSTINEPYWKHVDSVIDYCATKNIIVWAFPDYLGYGGPGTNQGFYDETASASTAQMKIYGDSLGRRYATRPNIVWGIGGDCDPTPVKAKLDSMMSGINSYCDYPRTPRNEEETFASDHWNTISERMSVNFNGFYAYTNTLYTWANSAYNWRPAMPFILQETSYENEHSSTPQSLRAQAWYSVLGGGIAGQVFGNCPIWHFSQSSSPCGTEDWRIHLYDPGRQSMRFLKTVLTTRSWYNLIPDTSNTVADSGFGSSTTYCTTAYASDSSCIITYMPTRHQIRIKLSYIRGDSVACRWVNPANGTVIDLGKKARIRSTFNPPSSGDWLFVADGVSAALIPSPPVLNSPANGATDVVINPTLAWNASVGATTYRLQVAMDPGFGSTVLDDSAITSTSRLVTGLTTSTLYYWHVSAKNTAGSSPWSQGWHFTTTNLSTVQIPLTDRWNIVSVPLTVNDPRTSVLFPTAISRAFGFVPGVGYLQRDTLLNGKGYWLKFDTAQNAGVTGLVRVLDTVAVQPGWNIVGSISFPVDTSMILSIPPGIRVSSFFEYLSGYTAAAFMNPGKGYWVKTRAAGQFILPAVVPYGRAGRNQGGIPSFQQK